MSYSSQTGGFTRIYLIIMGAIFLIVGIGVALFLGSIPYAGGGMLLMGAIFAIVGGVLIVAGILIGRNVSAQNQIMQTGIAGSATITGLTQTGVYVNEQPQIKMNLLVQLPGETAYATNHTEVVPLMMLGRLSNGQPLAVRVDQMDRSKLVIDWSGNPMAAAAPIAGMPAAGQTDESLAQVQAALAGTGGMAVANPFSQPGQANYTVEQLRAYLRQNGLQASGAHRQDGRHGPDRGRRARLQDGDDAQYPRPNPAETARFSGDGAGGEGAQALPGHGRAGALRRGEPRPAHGRVGQDLS